MVNNICNKRLSLKIKDNRLENDETQKMSMRSSHNLPNTNILNSNRSLPKTNLEKIVECLYDIKNQFEKQSNKEYSDKVSWVIKEVNSNKMYYYYGEGSTENPEESKYLKLYSPDFNIDRELHTVKHSKTNLIDKNNFEIINDLKEDMNRRTSMIITLNNHPLKIDELEKKNIIIEKDKQIEEKNDKFEEIKTSHSEINFNKYTKKEDIPYENRFIKPLDCKEDFGVYFDVFSYANEVGRVFLLWQVTLASFAYKNIYNLLDILNLENYVEEVRIGYTSQPSAYYHNVSNIFINI